MDIKVQQTDKKWTLIVDGSIITKQDTLSKLMIKASKYFKGQGL